MIDENGTSIISNEEKRIREEYGLRVSSKSVYWAQTSDVGILLSELDALRSKFSTVEQQKIYLLRRKLDDTLSALQQIASWAGSHTCSVHGPEVPAGFHAIYRCACAVLAKCL